MYFTIFLVIFDIGIIFTNNELTMLCLERKATGKRKRNEPKVNYCHKIMPDGTNKSIFSDLDREECKEKKRRTGSKRKCTCKCLPGWKKGKSLDADGNKVILCTVVSSKFILAHFSVISSRLANFHFPIA